MPAMKDNPKIAIKIDSIFTPVFKMLVTTSLPFHVGMLLVSWSCSSGRG